MAQPVASTFQYCPRCGAEQAKTGDNPFRCSSCDFVFFFSPTSAVAGIVLDDSAQVLLLRRARDPGRGKFGLPGGFVDVGESAEVALAREMAEEVQLKPIEMRYLCSQPNMYVYKGIALPVTDIFFVCRVATFEGMQPQETEVAGMHICHPTVAELDEMAFPSNRRA